MAQGRSTKIISMMNWIQTDRLSKANSPLLVPRKLRAKLPSILENPRTLLLIEGWSAENRGRGARVAMDQLRLGLAPDAGSRQQTLNSIPSTLNPQPLTLYSKP
jgi:hypothetical protein